MFVAHSFSTRINLLLPPSGVRSPPIQFQHLRALRTDGIDGNAIFTGVIIDDIKIEPSVIKEFLKNNYSARFFQKQKGSIVTRVTHFNLMDIEIVLH